MLGMSKGLDLDIVGSMPVLLKHPSFAVKESMWVKKDDHPTIDKVHIITKRYEYIKIGKTFGFETTRYICIFQDHLFYFDVAVVLCRVRLTKISRGTVQWIMYMYNGFV